MVIIFISGGENEEKGELLPVFNHSGIHGMRLTSELKLSK